MRASCWYWWRFSAASSFLKRWSPLGWVPGDAGCAVAEGLMSYSLIVPGRLRAVRLGTLRPAGSAAGPTPLEFGPQPFHLGGQLFGPFGPRQHWLARPQVDQAEHGPLGYQPQPQLPARQAAVGVRLHRHRHPAPRAEPLEHRIEVAPLGVEQEILGHAQAGVQCALRAQVP